MEITGLNAEETYKAEKQLNNKYSVEHLFGDVHAELERCFPTPTLDWYARRNGLDAK